ncbi:MAG: hypothetical protein PHV18_10285 [Lachnospiraceae bacterium]|nr:hypothetical protein [Lachnospiraceae bacterium]
MDERIVNSYLKIRAELMSLILIVCAVSLVVKYTFLKMPFERAVTEYIILVGSPIYMAVRSRMLGVTQIAGLSGRRDRKRTALVAGLCVGIAVYILSQANREGSVDWGETMVFGLAFAAAFIAIGWGYRKYEEKRQKELDSKYGE